MARADSIAWRNQANDGNLLLSVNASNQLTFDGAVLLTTLGVLTANRALISSAGGDITTSATTAAQIAFLSAVASAVSGNSDAATYLNKLLSDSTVLFANVSDPTKRLQFALGGLTTATTRTVTWPDADLTVVGLTTTQTLTNKTLTAPNVNAPVLRWTIQSPTSNFNVSTDSGYCRVNANSGGVTATLPAANLNTGMILTLQKTDATFNAVTITDGSFSTTLNTQNESVVLEANASSWTLVSRYIPSPFTSFTPTVTGLGTPVITQAKWRRVGQMLELNCSIEAGTPSGTDLKVSFPSGLQSTVATRQIVLSSVTTTNTGWASGVINVLLINGDTTGIYFSVNDGGGSGFNVLPGASVLASGDDINFVCQVPIDGWNA